MDTNPLGPRQVGRDVLSEEAHEVDEDGDVGRGHEADGGDAGLVEARNAVGDTGCPPSGEASIEARLGVAAGGDEVEEDVVV